jgi:hypothetical protein
MDEKSAGSWAAREFGTTQLGDVRRVRRLVAMAGSAARRPSGKVSAVFNRGADREGAYDFLENDSVRADVVAESMFGATVARARGIDCAYVAIDGSALSLTDLNGAKGFGPVGSPNAEVKGLKVMNALAVARDGVPLGLVDQIYWNRPATEPMTTAERTKRNKSRPFEEKETAYFVRAARNAIDRLAREDVRAWVVIDREADNRDILLGLHDLGCIFTVRGRWDRKLFGQGADSLHDVLDAQPSLGSHDVDIGRTGRRAARTATVEVRAAIVTLRFPARGPLETEGLRLYAVRVREQSVGNDGLEWLLLTNAPVLTAEHARQVIDSYRTRWRIEEFHRTWKQGECNVEDAQLRSIEAVIKWATVLSAVAIRIERLKYFARNKPDEPASVELAAEEIEALKLDQQSRMRAKPRKLPEMPSISEATRWVADIGGWIGPRNGPPGSTILARGLERLGYLVEGIALARQPPQGGRRKGIS